MSLPQRPAKSVTMTVRREAGPESVVVSFGAALIITPENYARPRRVNIVAGEDADSLGAAASFSVSAAGYTARTVSVQVGDNDPIAPVFTSRPVRTGVVGTPYRYDANASGLPAPIFRLLAATAGMTIDPATGVVDWTPAAAGVFTVTISARNGIAPTATQTFTLSVIAN